MKRREKRIQLRFFAQDDSVPDNEALVETKMLRHMDRLEALSKDTFKAWMLAALKNQYLNDMGMVSTGHTQQPINSLNDRPPQQDTSYDEVAGWSEDDADSIGGIM